MRAPDPPDEVERLNALAGYRIAGSPPEPIFDDLTALASHLCGAPISLITLIESDRQWIKSRVGLDIEETSRDVSFCAHAILEDGVFVVPDALADRRFADNPLVTEDPNIRFYAGSPLLTSDGHALGTLCVLDRVPRELSPEQELALAALSRAVMAHLDLHRQHEQLRELDRLKDEFVALVSHELRTPLSSIRGYVELLLEGAGGPLSEQQEKFLQVVGRNGERLLTLAEDLLFLARAEAGRLPLQKAPLDLRDVVAAAVENARPVAEEKGLELRTELAGAVPVEADRERLGQVADNLVSNAVKFTPAGGLVVVRAARHGRQALLEVVDSGIGIPAQELLHVFGRFYRTTAATDAAIPGTGLGLAICRAIVDAHGGVVEVESEPGVGSTFRVRLPA